MSAMITNLANRVDALAVGLPDSDPRKADFRSRIAALSNECGCTMGGVFLVVAAAVVIAFFIATSWLSVATGLLGCGFVLAMSLLGKVVGLFVVRVRLVAMRRTVERRLCEGGVRYVDVH